MVCSRFTVQQENRVYVHIPDIYHEHSSLHEQEKEMSKEMLKLEERRESSQEMHHTLLIWEIHLQTKKVSREFWSRKLQRAANPELLLRLITTIDTWNQ